MVKNSPVMQGPWVQYLGWEDSLEKATATHSSILAWRIPWTEEPGGLQSMGLQRVGHDCDCLFTGTLTITYRVSNMMIRHLFLFVCFISGNGTIYLSGCSGQRRESPPSIQSTSNPVNPPLPHTSNPCIPFDPFSIMQIS